MSPDTGVGDGDGGQTDCEEKGKKLAEIFFWIARRVG